MYCFLGKFLEQSRMQLRYCRKIVRPLYTHDECIMIACKVIAQMIAYLHR